MLSVIMLIFLCWVSQLSVVMQIVAMLIVIMLNVVMLNVVAPF